MTIRTAKPDEARSRVMRAVRSKDTGPEMVVRRLAHSLGYRYHLHRPDLPGKPDIVFPGRRKAVFVHGCFWHGHMCRRGAREPKDNADYWRAKIARNRGRDEASARALAELGWDVLTVWECETAAKGRDALTARLNDFLARANGLSDRTG